MRASLAAAVLLAFAIMSTPAAQASDSGAPGDFSADDFGDPQDVAGLGDMLNSLYGQLRQFIQNSSPPPSPASWRTPPRAVGGVRG